MAARNPRSKPSEPRSEPPRIEALRAFLVFAETGSVTATAERLGISQPVVSTKLEAFRDGSAVGRVLLDDFGLTPEAELALPTIRQLVRSYDELIAALSAGSAISSRLHIALGAMTAQRLFPLTLARFTQQFDFVGVKAHVARGEERILGVANGRYDAAIVSHAKGQIDDLVSAHRPRLPPLEIEKLANHLLVAIAARSCPLGRELRDTPLARTLPISWLVGKNLLGLDRNSGLRRQLELNASPDGALKFLVEGGGWQAARELARHGLGLAVVPLEVLSPADEEAFVIRRLSDSFQPASRLIYRANHPLPLLAAWRAAVKDVAQELEAATERRWSALVKEAKAEWAASPSGG